MPFFGWALWSSKHILVNRSSHSHSMASLKKAREKIAEGLSVVFFPEGTRSHNGELLPFKRGGFLLAMKTQTPIVPITINGSGNILPKRDWRIREGEIEVIVGDPVSVNEVHVKDLQSLMSRVRQIILAHSQQRVETPAVQPKRHASSGTSAEVSLREDVLWKH